MINMNNVNDTKKLNAFNMKYTPANIKKLLKCTEVIDLSEYSHGDEVLKSITQIDEKTLDDLVLELCDFDINTMTKISSYRKKECKYFVFSDDAQSSLFALKKSKDFISINFFEIDEDGIDAFIENIELIKSNSDLIKNLNEAKEMFGSLQNIEYEFGINLTCSRGDDEIDSKIQDLEKETEDASEQISDMLSWS